MCGTPFAFPREGNGYGTHFIMNTAWFLEDLMKNGRFTTLGNGLHATPLKQQMLCMSHQKFFPAVALFDYAPAGVAQCNLVLARLGIQINAFLCPVKRVDGKAIRLAG